MSKVTLAGSDAWPADAEAGVVEPAPTAWERVRHALTNPYLTLISRLVLGGIFFIAGIAKIGVPDTMAYSINAYDMHLPKFLVDIMAVGMPILEVGIGIFLLAGLFIRFSSAVSAALMVVFMIALTQAWIRGLNIDCGCFGGAQANSIGVAIIGALGPVGTFLQQEKADLITLVRDAVLLLMAVHLMIVPSIFSLDRLRARQAEQYEEEEPYEEAQA